MQSPRGGLQEEQTSFLHIVTHSVVHSVASRRANIDLLKADVMDP